MANHLKMATVDSILRLYAQGRSQRQISIDLDVDRKAVSRYVRLAKREAASAAALSGVHGPDPVGALLPPPPVSKGANAPTGTNGPDVSDSLPATVAEFLARPAGQGRPSDCEPYRELIVAKLDQGLSAKRIYQDLAQDHGCAASYWSVRRFVQGLGAKTELPFRRMECAPGQEAQVDFGSGAPIVVDGKRRKTNVFRIVLSHSRKAYSEATFTQTAEDFIRCLENAFAYFGGVPQTLVIDNLKAAVLHPDWFDPVLNPKLQAFAQHYNTVILPTKPYMPRHKGKVESSVKYVKNNALKGRTFAALEAENRFLVEWECTIADTRIHGTTKRQVGTVFREVERAALQPLPLERFPFFHEAQRKVNRDGHVEVAKAYYSAPPEYLGRKVWARWDARLVRLFNQRFEQIAMHVRHEPGKFSTLGEHLPAEKISGVERGATWLLGKIRSIGEQALAWAETMLKARGIEGIRVLQGLLSLAKTHSSAAIDEACRIALSYGALRLKTLRELLKRRGVPQLALPLIDEDPLIRPLSDYGDWVRATLAAHGGRDHRAPSSLPPDPHPPSPLLCSDVFNQEK